MRCQRTATRRTGEHGLQDGQVTRAVVAAKIPDGGLSVLQVLPRDLQRAAAGLCQQVL